MTNTWPSKTFGKGQSLELIRSSTFAALDSESLTPEQREHPTKVYYTLPLRYNITSIETHDPLGDDVAVDTIEDLRRNEAML